ncbi:NADH:ubiquinone oxidoreductase [Yoonia sp.]|uniref:NADH:ubiquinone oxidoreductase n=1 Tax=Yoonia sp. TaxID=2212373 RepID=UPI003F6F761A
MNNTAPIWMGIAAIAGLVFVVALGVAYVLYDLGLVGAVFVAIIVAGIAGLALALGWRPARNDGVATPEAAAPAAAPAPAAPPASAATSGAGTKPATLAAARGGQPDDLRQLSGVGPKMEQTLHAMGIFHFDQIASWGPQELAWMDANLQGLKGRASRDGWVAQAKALAAGA